MESIQNGLIKDLEKVQMKATKLVISVKTLDTSKDSRDWIYLLHISDVYEGTSLKWRTHTAKTLTRKLKQLELLQDNVTRGHNLKLVNSRCHIYGIACQLLWWVLITLIHLKTDEIDSGPTKNWFSITRHINWNWQ